MNWYSAHIIMYVELRDRTQQRYPVWENIVLIKARDADAAFETAERRGRSEEGDSDGSFRWGKHPARWVFAGVRKLTECVDASDRPADGTEVSYTEFELESLDAVRRLAAGKSVQVQIADRFPLKDSRTNSVGKAEPKPAKKRTA
jgi:hypothetical protein